MYNKKGGKTLNTIILETLLKNNPSLISQINPEEVHKLLKELLVILLITNYDPDISYTSEELVTTLCDLLFAEQSIPSSLIEYYPKTSKPRIRQMIINLTSSNYTSSESLANRPEVHYYRENGEHRYQASHEMILYFQNSNFTTTNRLLFFANYKYIYNYLNIIFPKDEIKKGIYRCDCDTPTSTVIFREKPSSTELARFTQYNIQPICHQCLYNSLLKDNYNV